MNRGPAPPSMMRGPPMGDGPRWQVLRHRNSKVNVVHLLLDIRMVPHLGQEVHLLRAFEEVIVAKWTGIDQDVS